MGGGMTTRALLARFESNEAHTIGSPIQVTLVTLFCLFQKRNRARFTICLTWQAISRTISTMNISAIQTKRYQENSARLIQYLYCGRSNNDKTNKKK